VAGRGTPVASRSIDLLRLDILEKYELFSEEMRKAGLRFVVTCTARSLAEQVMLFCQGRMELRYVNQIRGRLNFAPLAPDGNKIVTWTLNSKHVVDERNHYSKAFDIVLFDVLGNHTWNIKVDVNNNEIPDYIEAGKIGEKCGLIWGGRFKTPDYCHFEI